MSLHITRHVSIAGACAGLLFGCVHGDDEEARTGPRTLAQEAALDGGLRVGKDDAASRNPDLDPSCTERFPEYRPGLSVRADDLTLRIVSALPVPPRQVVPNTWIIEILAASGVAVTGARLENADSYMPLHDHFGAAPPFVEALPDGRFKLDNLDFTMRGAWEVFFDVTPPAATDATRVTFRICVE